MPEIFFTHDSFLKTRPVPSEQLGDNEKSFVAKGTTISVAAIAPYSERGHTRITLSRDAAGKQRTIGGKNTVYLFSIHTSLQAESGISQAGIDLIRFFEGAELEAYQDAVGIWTVGFGHVSSDVYPGLKITRERAEALLKEDLRRFEKGVASLVKVSLTQGQRDALISFAFNLGLGALEDSTLLRLLNDGNYQDAASEFMRWTKAGSQELLGLKRRRAAEKALFEGRDWRTAIDG